MLTNNTDVTIFSKKTLGRQTLWFGHQLKGVNFYGAKKIVIADKDVTNSDEYIVRIPENLLTDYFDNKTWNALSIDELFGHFTLQKGDYVVKGLVDTNINSSAEIVKLPDVKVITEVTENLNASKFSRHIKLVLK